MLFSATFGSLVDCFCYLLADLIQFGGRLNLMRRTLLWPAKERILVMGHQNSVFLWTIRWGKYFYWIDMPRRLWSSLSFGSFVVPDVSASG
jgi:hypothetical protein